MVDGPWSEYKNAAPWEDYDDGLGETETPLNNKPSLPPANPNRQASPREMWEIAKTALNPMKENVGAFGRGVVQGATFDQAGKSQTQNIGLEGSVFQPEAEKTFGKAGRFIGQTAPIAAAMTVGAPMAGAMGAGSMGSAAMAGLLHGTARGAAQNKGWGGSLNEGATDMAMFPLIEGGLKVVNGFAKFLGNETVDTIANWWLKTKSRVAESRSRSGKPSAGMDMMNKTNIGLQENAMYPLSDIKLPDFTTREEAKNYSQFQVKRLSNQIEGRLNQLKQEAMTPNVPEVVVPEAQRFLEYKPATVQNVSSGVRSGTDLPIRARQGEQLPAQIKGVPETTGAYSPIDEVYRKEQMGGMTEPVFERDTLGTMGYALEREPVPGFSIEKKVGEINKAPLGVPVRAGESGTLESGIPAVRGKYSQDALGFPVYEGPEQAVSEPIKSGIGKAAKQLGEPKRYRFATSRDIAVPTEDIAASLDPLLEKYLRSFGPDDHRYLNILKIKENFVKNNPRYMDLNSLNGVRKGYDYDLGLAHEQNIANLPVQTEAERILSDAIRGKIHSNDKALGELFDEQHLFLQIYDNLVSATAKKGFSGGFWNAIEQSTLGSSPALATARALHATPGFGKPLSGQTKQRIRTGARSAGISYEEESQEKNKQRFDEVKKRLYKQ